MYSLGSRIWTVGNAADQPVAIVPTITKTCRPSEDNLPVALAGHSIASMEAEWLGWQGSNLRMSVPKTDALPLGYTPAEGADIAPLAQM